MCNKNKQLFLLGLVASGLAGDCNKNNHCSSGEFCYSSSDSACSNRNCDCHDCDDYNGAPGFTSGTQNCQRYENICGGDCTASAPAPTRRPTPRPVAATPRPTPRPVAAPTPRPTAFDGTFDDSTIETAVAAWLADATAAEATYGHISTWDTSRVTDMGHLFSGNWNNPSSFNEDIGAWDTSGATRMVGMFAYATAFNQDISAWDTSGVTAMDAMFQSADAFNQDLSAWDTSGVKTMYAMFYGADAFNQDLGWCFYEYDGLRGVQIGNDAFRAMQSPSPCRVRAAQLGCTIQRAGMLFFGPAGTAAREESTRT